MKNVQKLREVMIARLEYNCAQWRAGISPGLDYSSDAMWVHIVIQDARRAPLDVCGVTVLKVSHRGVESALQRLQSAIRNGLFDRELAAFYR